jgi:5-methyltetrahydrofolate--homocysteine methyltransferase
MGTMIQRYKLGEADFRGERFSHPHDLKGNNDLLVPHAPDVIPRSTTQYLEAGADIIETNTFTPHAIAQADYGLEHPWLRAQRRGRPARARAGRRFTAQGPAKPRFVAGSIGPTNKHALDLARRQRPGASARSPSTR